jgi:uncharacterized repeat protein (TIGR03803 family)
MRVNPHGCRTFVAALLVSLCPLPIHQASAASYSLFHSFLGAAADGKNPLSDLTIAGSKLFGTTPQGGASNAGTLFSIGTDGSDYTLLRSFGGTGDGTYPQGGMAVSGTTLFGTTGGGVTNHQFGTIFSMDVHGGSYQVLRSLAFSEGSSPIGNLEIAGSRVYGTTQGGGTNGGGTAYSMNLDGSDFQVLHTFRGGLNDGLQPLGGVTVIGDTVYGTTGMGGLANIGTVYALDTDGSDFHLLHAFLGSDGITPAAELTTDGSVLYGTTFNGGSKPDGGGTVFALNADGTAFHLVHSFAGGPADGSLTEGGVTLVGSKLYGTTVVGGAQGYGSVFSVNPDGSDFQLLYSFAGGPGDGRQPYAGLTSDGSTLFGTTNIGGSANSGTLFAFNVPEPSGMVLALVASIGWTVWRCGRRRRI